MSIQIKRGQKIDLPISGKPGEPLVTLDTQELYVGDSNNEIKPIRLESNNLTDKGIANGVAILDNEALVAHGVQTERLLFNSVIEKTIDFNENAEIQILPKTEFRLFKWLVNVADLESGGFYSCEIIAHHDGTAAEFSEYGVIGTETVSFNVSVVASNIILYGIATKNNQVVRVITTAVRFS